MGRKKKNLIGEIFGRLVVIEELSTKVYKNSKMRRFLCLCECGTTTEVYHSSLTTSNTKSCGCLYKEVHATMDRGTKTHGLSDDPLYRRWASMKTRCYNENFIYYKNYGGRGIKVCDRWLESFENFYEDMAKTFSANLELDRIDNNKGYSPENCRWVERNINQNNKRKRSESTSNYWGVSLKKETGKWQATVNGIYLGYFDSEVEAARFREKYILDNNIEAKLNGVIYEN